MTDAIVDQSRIDPVRIAIEAEHTSLCVLPHVDHLDRAAAADRAQGLGEFDPERRQEIGAPNDRDSADAVLFGTGDTPSAWLYAGEALSAGWLTATAVGVHVLPLTAAGGGVNPRQVLRRLVPSRCEPFLVLRFSSRSEPFGARAPLATALSKADNMTDAAANAVPYVGARRPARGTT